MHHPKESELLRLKTPLFLDGLGVEPPYSPMPFLINQRGTNAGYPREAIAVSFSQNLVTLMAFRELSRLTGEQKYVDAASETAEFALSLPRVSSPRRPQEVQRRYAACDTPAGGLSGR